VDGIGEMELFNMTAKFSKTPGKAEMPPPKLGEHTEIILRELGYTAEQITQLRAESAI